MQITFLGTGNCAGVPVYNCRCAACSAARKKQDLRRRSCCALLTTPDTRILIDAGMPDLGDHLVHDQPDLVLLTHYHIDHVLGLFAMRWGETATPVPVYGPDDPSGCDDLLKHPGIFDFSNTLRPFQPVNIANLTLTPLPLTHSKLCLGLAIESPSARLAWLSDTGGLPHKTLDFLSGWRPTMTVLDCTFPPLDSPHPNHNDLLGAIAIHRRIGSGTCRLTHIGHELDLWLASNDFQFPAGIEIARDMMTVDL